MKAKFLFIALMICLSVSVVGGGLSACSAGIGPHGAGASIG